MARGQKYLLDLKFPLKGLMRKMAFQAGPGPYTTYDALNVRPTDPFLERERGGSRPGMGKAYITELGSGNPVRLLDTLTYVGDDGYKEFYDTFEGNSLSSDWSVIGTSGLPAVTDNIASVSFTDTAGAAALAVQSDLDTSQSYTAGMFIMPYNGEHHGIYTIYIKMDDTTPAPTTDGIVCNLNLIGASSPAATIDSYASGVKTEEDTGTGTQGYVASGWFEVVVSGDDVSMYWNGEALASATVAGLTGTRVGFAVTCTESGGICLIDSFRHQYYEAEANERNTNLLLASSNGLLYKGSVGDAMSLITSDLTLASDRLLCSAERAQKLYIADIGVAQKGTDGTISGSELTDSVPTDWTTIGANTDDYVVVISNGTGAVTNGNYTISSIASGAVTLSSAPGDGTCSYSIERGTKIYDPSDDSLALWTATSGKGTIPQGQPLIARYRDRIVLAGGLDAPHVWYMSRQGDALDWDYSQEDPATAVAGTNADAGTPGEAIIALVNTSDDYLVFGCQRSIWILRGDPAYGGQLDNLSENIGFVDKQSWCYGPEGQLIFLSKDGIYGLQPGSQQYPQSISRDVLPQELRDISNETYTVTMEYDIRHRGIHIYLTSEGTQTRKHWWFDWEQKSFWPVTLATGFEPTATTVYYSRNLRKTIVVIGSKDGYLRYYNRSFETDEGTDIDNYITFGPIKIGSGLNEGNVVELTCTMGKNSGDVTWALIVDETPEETATGSNFETGTWTEGHNYNNHPRGRGDAMVLKITGSGSRRWAYEGATATIRTVGKHRKV